MFFGGINIPDKIHIVNGLSMTTPSTSTPAYISLKNAMAVEVRIKVKNGSTVTGSAITLKQASAVANTGEKALAFNWVYVDGDTAAADVPWVKTAVTSNTFTTLTTNSKLAYYRIPVDPASLDLANNFDCIRAGTGDGVNTTLDVDYLIIYKDGYGNAGAYPSAILD
jgi:hypothetical protein